MNKPNLKKRRRFAVTAVCVLGLLISLGCSKGGDAKPKHNPKLNPKPVSAPSQATLARATLSQATLDRIKSMTAPKLDKPIGAVRFATFNVSFHRNAAGELAQELSTTGSHQPSQIAEIIQRVRPDIILLNEFDYDEQGIGLQHFQNNYLKIGQNGQQPIEYPHVFSAPVNTGLDSGLDLDVDGQKGGPGDAYGYGAYPGQYGMAVLSHFPVNRQTIRSFQKFLWKDMPTARWPVDPDSGKPFYSDEAKAIFRLSSKSHWDVPIQIGHETVHFLVSHPTPPVFDGPEDRNGCRNHDEIRFWLDYVSGAEYFYDDAHVKGGLEKGSRFVIAGDLNADPADGDSTGNPLAELLNHMLIDKSQTPYSLGGIFSSALQGEANERHAGKPEFDTSCFASKTGNLRVDYCLPGGEPAWKVLQAGVFWPMPEEDGGELVAASDHRLTWVDVQFSVK
jgi:3-phytase/alkaline phosphatase D